MRLSTQLHQMNKKYEILKEEINKFENQRSNLISKINSVNEVIKDTNVLTNVFENNVDSKIKIIDPIKQANKNIKRDLDEEISKIFSK